MVPSSTLALNPSFLVHYIKISPQHPVTLTRVFRPHPGRNDGKAAGKAVLDMTVFTASSTWLPAGRRRGGDAGRARVVSIRAGRGCGVRVPCQRGHRLLPLADHHQAGSRHLQCTPTTTSTVTASSDNVTVNPLPVGAGSLGPLADHRRSAGGAAHPASLRQQAKALLGAIIWSAMKSTGSARGMLLSLPVCSAPCERVSQFRGSGGDGSRQAQAARSAAQTCGKLAPRGTLLPTGHPTDSAAPAGRGSSKCHHGPPRLAQGQGTCEAAPRVRRLERQTIRESP